MDNPVNFSPYVVVSLRDRMRALIRDTENKRKYGPWAPLYGEQIWVAPVDIRLSLPNGPGRRFSGRVLPGDWDQATISLTSDPKISYCLRHWCQDQSWEAAGAIDHMTKLIAANGSADGCKSRADIDRRYSQLDRIFDEISKAGRLKPAAEARPGSFRECGGVFIHIGRDGQLLFGRGGHHRLAIALALGLASIPSQVGVVHATSLQALALLRVKSGPNVK